jgi:hypothetical protein
MILIGGRTGLQIQGNPGALEQNSSALTVTPGFDRRGLGIFTINRRSNGPEREQAGDGSGLAKGRRRTMATSPAQP